MNKSAVNIHILVGKAKRNHEADQYILHKFLHKVDSKEWAEEGYKWMLYLT
jgi:hypothetical protein